MPTPRYIVSSQSVMSQTWGQFENFRSSAQRVTRIAKRDHNARYLLAEPAKIADTIRSITFTEILQMSPKLASMFPFSRPLARQTRGVLFGRTFSVGCS